MCPLSYYQIMRNCKDKRAHRYGNDTIDRYPLLHKRKLIKLLCISKMVFEKLKTALDEFGIKSKPRLSKPKTPFSAKDP